MKTIEINAIVARNFERYRQIKSKDKSLGSKEILLKETKTHPLHQCGDSEVTFADASEEARLNIGINVDKTKSFRFRLMCDSFMQAPCYRFESDGGTHRNPPQEGVTLRQRQIPTPHFHRYDEDGRSIAYKTEELVNDEQGILADYDKALRHFCREENINVGDDVSIMFATFPLGTCDFPDPLEGVEFK